MTQVSSFAVDLRDRAGKGPARATRRSGRVPGVIYGNKESAVLISLDPRDINRELHKPGFFARLFDLKMGEVTQRVLARDVQFDKVTDRPIHVDFLRVSPDSRIHVTVPVRLVNEATAPGIKKGGSINFVQHEIELDVPATDIPEEIVIDLAGFEIGQSVHISAIALPAGAKALHAERDFTILSIVPPAGGTQN